MTSPHRRRGHTLLLRLALTTIAAVAGLLGSASQAQAHSELTSSDPAASARLSAAPSQVNLTFSDEVNPQFVTIRLTIGPSAAAMDLPHTTSGAKVTATVPASASAPSLAPSGAEETWTVAYRVVSADGHPIAGSYSFTIAAPTPTTADSSVSPPAANPFTTTSPDVSTTVPATVPSTSVPGVNDAAARAPGGRNATGDRLPPAVMAIIALPLLATAAVAVWWFRRQSRNSG